MSILGTMSGALNKKQPQAPTVSPTPEKDNSGTMASNVANILNSNSLLMRSAAAKGERIAANRGLQNSTLGAEAAQRAMLDAAIPIAAQDTQHQFAASQANLDRGHQKDLAKLQADLNYSNQSRLNQEQNRFAASQADLDRGHQRGLAQLQADLSYQNQSRLNDTQNKFAASQADLDRAHQRGLTQLQSDLNYNNQSRLAKLQSDLNYSNQSRLNQAQYDFTASQNALDRANQRELANLNHQNEMRNLNAQVSANTIGKSIDFTMQIANNFDAQIAGILNNTAMKAEDKEKAIKTLKSSRDSEINFVSKFMQGIPTTKQNWSSFPSLGVPSIGIK